MNFVVEDERTDREIAVEVRPKHQYDHVHWGQSGKKRDCKNHFVLKILAIGNEEIEVFSKSSSF